MYIVRAWGMALHSIRYLAFIHKARSGSVLDFPWGALISDRLHKSRLLATWLIGHFGELGHAV